MARTWSASDTDPGNSGSPGTDGDLSQASPTGDSGGLAVADLFFCDPVAALDLAQHRPDALDSEVIRQAGACKPRPALLLDPDAVGMAVVDADCTIHACTQGYAADAGGIGPAASSLRRDLVGRALALGRAVFDAETETLKASCYVPARLLAEWHLPEPIARAMSLPARVVVFSPRIGRPGAIARACAAYRLRPSHVRVVDATIRYGTIGDAARSLGLSHQRARVLIADALSIARCGSVQELVSRIASEAFGVVGREDVPLKALLMETWGVTPRQAELALLISDGHSRQSAARFVRMSDATVKKELTYLYQALGIASAPELSVRLAVLQLHAQLVHGGGVRGDMADLGAEPLAFAFSRDGRRIAYSDHGPKDGIPLIYVHSSMTSRIVPRSLCQALAAKGFRVVALDRPGFGLTDPAPDRQFGVAAEDFCMVQDMLGLHGAIAVARGGAQFLLELARLRPHALGGAVLVNPDPCTRASRRRQGPLGALKEYFARSPVMIGALAGMAASALTRDHIGQWMLRSVAASAADRACLQQPGVVEDYWRGVRAFTTGALAGYIAEQVELASAEDQPLDRACWPWVVMLGEQDMLHDPGFVADYWSARLPRSRVERVADAGRLLSFSHVDRVVEAARWLYAHSRFG